MSIDWVTLLAQIANFLLLVWLLKRFLYRPILRGIDEREAEIARRMRQAEQAKEQARQAELDYLQRSEQLLSSQQERLAAATAAAQQQRDKILQQARQQLEQEQQQWHEFLQQERQEFIRQLEVQAAYTLAELLRSALHELSGQPLEQAMLQRLPQRIEPMLAELQPAIGSKHQATITSASEICSQGQQQFVTDMKKLLPQLQWEFVLDEKQSPGLRLQMGGAQLDWTIESYVDSLRRLMSEQFVDQAGPTD
ncbi:MAG: F0F1 ATP synthase subunit B [Gammaproteobacteria bacterium]|nr:F0F1 ATP synthase subunit B [Gammaproteobacteria bacterium]